LAELLPTRAVQLLIALALTIAVLLGSSSTTVWAGREMDDQVCDPLADYYLGMEDYPAAIRRHEIVIHEHPNNALAYYHLGFALGMTGDHRGELADYQKAVDLGLSDWQLFLNMGLLYLGEDRYGDAAAVLRLAEVLGPYHPETHFNLALAYERLGMYNDAQQEMLLSLKLDPNQIDAHNQLGVIYAEEGNFARAHDEWTALANANPQYAPARANLAILDRIERGEVKGPPRLTGLAHAP
jgi:tetratricopeptide (TPR) repeat protein